jgi:hypothetical protein
VGIGLAESVAIAKANGASFGIAMNGKLEDPQSQIMLPLKQEEFPEHCPRMMNGGSGYKMQGYDCGEGPLKVGRNRIMGTLLIPFTNLLAHPIFMGMVMSHNVQIGCTNEPGDSNKIPVRLQDLEECKQHDAEAQWTLVWAQTEETENAGLTTADFVPWKPTADAQGSLDEGDVNVDTSGIGAINVDQDAVEQTGGNPDQALGSGLALRVEERSSDIIDVGCRSPELPFYQAPITGMNSDLQGQILPFNSFGFPGEKISNVNEFTWYSGDHVRNGPKTVGGYFIRSARRQTKFKDQDGADKYVYVIEAVSMVSAGEVEMTPDEFEDYLKEHDQDIDTSASSSSTGCDKPKPWVLDSGSTDQQKKDFQNSLRFIALVYKDLEDDQPFWSTFFDSPPKRIIAYGQAQVYNYLEEDTFTQDWRVRLERANLLESFLEKVGVLDIAGGFVGAVNNH